MGTTWVEIKDHGIVVPAEFPPEYKTFINRMIPKNSDETTLIPAPEPLKDLDVGEEVFCAQDGPRTAITLADNLYSTGLTNSNLVGNLYFGNYSSWMGNLRDKFLHDINPSLFRGIGEKGELRCTNCEIQHLREAMPFDKIRVTMGLKKLWNRGMELYFEFYKENADGSLDKLAYGHHTAVWSEQGANGETQSSKIPDEIMVVLLEKIQTRLSDFLVSSNTIEPELDLGATQ